MKIYLLLFLLLPLTGFSQIFFGMTREEVVAELGEPSSSARLGKNEILRYPDGVQVHIREGGVNHVEGIPMLFRGADPLPETEPESEPEAEPAAPEASPPAEKAKPAPEKSPAPEKPDKPAPDAPAEETEPAYDANDWEDASYDEDYSFLEGTGIPPPPPEPGYEAPPEEWEEYFDEYDAWHAEHGQEFATLAQDHYGKSEFERAFEQYGTVGKVILTLVGVVFQTGWLLVLLHFAFKIFGFPTLFREIFMIALSFTGISFAFEAFVDPEWGFLFGAGFDTIALGILIFIFSEVQESQNALWIALICGVVNYLVGWFLIVLAGILLFSFL